MYELGSVSKSVTSSHRVEMLAILLAAIDFFVIELNESCPRCTVLSNIVVADGAATLDGIPLADPRGCHGHMLPIQLCSFRVNFRENGQNDRLAVPPLELGPRL